MSKKKEEYLRNPRLKTIREDYPGNLVINGKYRNDLARWKQPPFTKILKWQLGGNRQKQEKKEDQYRPALIRNTQFLSSTEDMVVWLGHASFFIRLNGVNILTDPCLGNVSGFLKRFVGIPCDIQDIRGLHYIMMSHGHRDHFDVPSLKKILPQNPDAVFLSPLGMTPLIRKVGRQAVQEAGWWQEFDLEEDVRITFLPAVHWNRRGLTDFNTMLWGSFWIQAGDKVIYFAGDTAYSPHFKQIREQMGRPQVVLMPIGAYKPPFVMKSSHTSPEEAVMAFNELEGERFVPMHFGTYDLSDEPIGEPIRKMRTLKEQGILKGALCELAVGEELKV